jgi:hypothetical protein
MHYLQLLLIILLVFAVLAILAYSAYIHYKSKEYLIFAFLIIVLGIIPYYCYDQLSS